MSLFDSPWSGCQDPFDGQVAVGGECANDWDCVSEYCSGESTDCDAGTCQALLADGSGCTGEDECASGGCNGGVCGAPTTYDGVE